MKQNNLPLLEVDEVKIKIIMDNTIDALLPGNDTVKRFDFSSYPLVADDGFFSLVAEHGFSTMIQVQNGNKQGAILYDAGVSPGGTLHNMETLGLDINDMQAIVLSHGHMDHTLGLPGLLDKIKSPGIPLVVHPDALLERKIMTPDGYENNISTPKLTEEQQSKITLHKKSDPTLLLDNTLLVSGEIDRTTDFETGFPFNYTKRNGQWEHDPLILDDQCIILILRGKGLVVLSACSHSGVVNTVRYAQKLTGCRQVHAVVGGFHLTGGTFEKIIPETVAALQEINPTYIVPGHCTGWAAMHQIIRTMPEKYIPSCVGSTLLFQKK